MLFLLNDAVLNLHAEDLSAQNIGRRFASVGFDYVQLLGQELFSGDPLVQRNNPERAGRLAALIHAKQPTINAALFVAPAKGCKPSDVGVRFAALDIHTLATLQRAHLGGKLDTVFADREVWRRLAA